MIFSVTLESGDFATHPLDVSYLLITPLLPLTLTLTLHYHPPNPSQQAFLATRTELESRCEGYLKEIKNLETDGASQTTDMQKHAVTLEAELQRVRTQNASLKDSLATVETQAKLSVRELSEVRTHARDVEEKAEEARREAKEAIAEQHRLREKR